MNKAPAVEEIREWLRGNNPLGVFGGHIDIEDVDQKAWSGHFNFLVSAGDKRFVLRFKGPEWGTPDGVKREYEILKKVAPHGVGPQVYYLAEDFFGEPMMLMEYLDGSLFTVLKDAEQGKLFEDIARFIACINDIPFKRDGFPFEEAMESYGKNKKAWRRRLDDIKKFPHLAGVAGEIESVLPVLEGRLDEYEPALTAAIAKSGSAFIFESAHAGHLMRTKDGFRFLNWEQVSHGDPSFMLAVFLSSVMGRPDFEDVKKRMSEAYLQERDVPGFERLLDQRLWERGVSNVIYRIWTDARKNGAQADIHKAGEQVAKVLRLSHV